MARQQYNITGANPAAGDQNPATALTRLRNLEAVDRFTGVNLVDGGATVGGVAFSNDTVTVTSANSITTPGNYVFFNKTITMGTNGTIHAAANGVHLYFVNCFIVYAVNSGINSSIGPAAASNSAAGTDARVAQGAAATRSVNYYGCSISAFTATFRMHVSDIVNSSLNAYSNTAALINFGAGGGSRLLNTTLSGPSGHSSGCIITYYGAPDLFEGFRGSFTNLEAPAAFGANQAILVEPNFTSLQAAQRYRMQAGGIPDRCYQAIGPFNPPNNNPLVGGLNADILSGSGTPYVWQAGANTGGVINYYGWQPGFFEDIAQTVGIEGVNIRVETSATLGTTTLNTETSADFDAGIGNQSGTIVDLTGEDLDHIVDYKTADTGLAVVGANTQMATNGTTFTTGQWIDWLRLGVYNATGYTTAPTTETAQNFLGQSAPDGCVIAPLSLVRNSSYNQFNTRFRARSYSHDVEVLDVQNGTVGTADGNQTPNVLSPIDNTQYIAADLVGSRVKAANIDAATNQPVFSFDGTQTASLQDFGNIARAAWSTYGLNPVFDGDDERPSAGPFDERTYPIRLVVSSSTANANNIYEGTGFGVREQNGQLRIAVNCAGIAPDVNDVAGNNPFTTSFNNGNQPLDLGGQLLETLGGCTNLRTLANGEINNSGTGAILFTQINNGSAIANVEDRITGVVTLNNTGAGGIDNLPPFLGRTTGEDTITIENSVSQATGVDRIAGGVTYSSPSGNGLYSPSTWTGVTTLSAFDYGEVRTITFNAGCNLEGNVSIAASEDSIWRFNALPDTLDLDLVNQTNLIRIETGATSTESTVRDGVRVWLAAQQAAGNISGFSEVRADQTAPTSGYWLVGQPEGDATTRTYQVPAMFGASMTERNGFFAVRNITTHTNLVEPVAINPAIPATYSYDIVSTAYNGTDTIMFYWRPLTTATEGYGTSMTPFTGTVTDGTTDLTETRIAAVLWEDSINTTGGASVVLDGNSAYDWTPDGGTAINRARFTYTGDLIGTNGASQTLYETVLACNDVDYFERIVNIELESDYVEPGIGEVLIDSRYAYVDSNNDSAQRVITSATDSAPTVTPASNQPNLVARNTTDGQGLGGNSYNAVIIQPNVAGATPGQIAGGVQSGLGAVTDRLDRSREAFNANPILTAPGQEWAE